MKKDIAAYVKTCHACQQRKIPRHRPFGTMQYIKVPSEAFHRVQIDVMGPFTTSAKGEKYVVTAIDYLTKWIEARALKEATTETIAKFFIEQIICRHDCPKILHTDRSTFFTSEVFQEINKFMGIKQHVSTSYHPQSQGLVEKSHSTLTDCLAMYTSANLTDWDNLLPHIIFSTIAAFTKQPVKVLFFTIWTRSSSTN